MDGPSFEQPAPVPPRARQVLPKAYRLDNAGYRSTFDNGKTISSRSFVMWIVLLDASAEGKVGTVAAKKTFHDSVDRNRARRLLREAYRKSREHLQQGAQIILLGRRKILDMGAPDVAAEFRKACIKADIWRE